MPYVVDVGPKKEYKKRLSYKKIKLIHLACEHIPFEIGGSLDFDKKGRFVRIQVFPPGKRDELTLHDNLILEWHSHPDESHVAFPSVTDLMAQAKRSINSNSQKPKKYKKFRGPLAIVFSRWGAVTYSYNRCKIPTKKDQKAMLDFIMRIANSTLSDTYPSMKLMAEFIRTYGFRICLQSWAEIKKKGLRLEWASRRFHNKPSKKK